MQHIKLDRKCLWSSGDLHFSPPPPITPPLSVISAFFSVFPAMFSSVHSCSSLGWARERVKRGERRSSVAVNSSHLSPGLSFNCSALPAGSLLLWSRATLFFHCFSWISFSKTTALRFLRHGDQIWSPTPTCDRARLWQDTMSFIRGGFQVFNKFDIQKHFEVGFFFSSFTCFNQAKYLLRFWQSLVRERRLV